MKTLIAAAFTLFLSNVSAIAGPVITEARPIADDPFRDYQIEGCTGLYGMGYYRYNTGSASKSDPVVLSDFCLDAEKGSFVSHENYSDLTLVKRSAQSEQFQKLDGQTNDYERLTVSLHNRDKNSKCSTDVVGARTIDIHMPSSRYISTGKYSQAAFYGFTVADTSNRPLAPETGGVHTLLLTGLSQDNGKPVDAGKTNLYDIELSGDLEFQNKTGTLSINQGISDTVGAATGTLSLEATANGAFLIKGELTAENARITGHPPKEWVSISISQLYMRGFFLGQQGEAMEARGLGTGSFVDASGKTHTLRVIAQLYSCLAK